MVADGTWVLCDFGSATSRARVYVGPEEIAAEEDNIRKHTTPAYRAPEVCVGGGEGWLLSTATGLAASAGACSTHLDELAAATGVRAQFSLV